MSDAIKVKSNMVRIPEELEYLQKELRNHPDIIKWLKEESDETFISIIANLARYFNIALDGDYGEKELKGLATLLTLRLQDKRKIIIK
jgi:hypothetical protein